MLARPVEPRASRMRLQRLLTSVVERIESAMVGALRGRRSDAEDDDQPPSPALTSTEMDTLEESGERALRAATADRALRSALRQIAVEVRTISRRDMQRVLGIRLSEEEFGELMNGFVRENAKLIRTLGRKQIRDVMSLVRADVPRGVRIEALAEDMIARFGVARRRAVLIARTETAKLKSQIDEERQKNVGVTHYIWRAVGGEGGDGRTRKMHRRLHGRRVAYSSPPVAEASGERHHPGRFPNCRCYAEPDLSSLGL